LAPFIRDLPAQVAADAPIERMLAVQIVSTFNRAMYLSRHANTQKTIRDFRFSPANATAR
jgi:hypothetical protein